MKAMELLRQKQLERFEQLEPHDKRIVLFELDQIAEGKGYRGQKQVHDERLYIWNQWCADVMSRLFPEKKF